MPYSLETHKYSQQNYMINTLKKLRCNIIVWSTHRVALPVIRLLMKPPEFPYSVAELHHMPEGSLGANLYAFLQRHHLHLLKDYESHDVKHTLLSYPATEEGEAALQHFFYGNGQRSFPVMITVIVSSLVMPEYRHSFKTARSRGRQTPPLNGTPWFSLLRQPMNDIINDLKIAQ